MKAVALSLLVGVTAVANPYRGGGPSDPGADDGPKRERMERRLRMMRVVGLAEALQLSESEALKLAEQMRGFDEKRQPLRKEMREAMKTLRQVAGGDTGLQGQVDAATAKILDNRAKLAALDKEMFNALAKNLSPQKRAQLALFLAEMQALGRASKEGRRMFRGPMGGKGDRFAD